MSELFIPTDQEEIKQRAANLVTEYDKFYDLAEKNPNTIPAMIIRDFEDKYYEQLQALSITSIDQLQQLELFGVAFDKESAKKAGIKETTQEKILDLFLNTNTTREQVVKVLKEVGICHKYHKWTLVKSCIDRNGVQNEPAFKMIKSRLDFIQSLFPNYIGVKKTPKTLRLLEPHEMTAA